MKNAAEMILGIIVMALAAVCVWEYTIISSLKKEVKSKQLTLEAQAVRTRNLQEQITEKDRTIQLLVAPNDQERNNEQDTFSATNNKQQ